MAGGKLTPRQKMINLMYLVFIAMMALNLSPEVLSAFGLMNEKLEVTNSDTDSRNDQFMEALAVKAKDEPAQYAKVKEDADKIRTLAKDLNDYLETLKTEMVAGVENKTDYEVMDKGDFLDSKFFKDDKDSDEGKVFLDKIAAFRDGVAAIVPSLAKTVETNFSTDDVKNRDGVKTSWLFYNYRGFPLIASLTKISQLQADVKTTESAVLGQMLQGKMASQLSFDNYKAVVVLDKTAFFQGDKVTGRIVLGRVDENTKPTRVTLNGANVDPSNFQQGGVVLNLTAGNLGENTLKGQFIFTEDGKEVPVPIESSYTVVPRPNSATISADKMNVVYRGVKNPMTISFAGVADSNVKANGPGLVKSSGTGKYIMDVTSVQGREVTINVTAMVEGKSVSDKKTFRVKGIPSPVGTVRGETGTVKGPKSNLEVSTVGAKLEDFDFDIGLSVTGFNIKAPGQPTVVVSGNKLDSRAKQAISKAGRGDMIIISEIKTKLNGAGNYMLPKTAPVAFEIQ